MGEFITLLGAEDVQRAANRISQAATDMNQAAMNFQAALEQHQRFMDDWLWRFTETLTKQREDTK